MPPSRNAVWTHLALACSVVWQAGVQAADRYAVIVGVETYRTLGTVKYAAADARLMARVLKEYGAFPEKGVILLTEGQSGRHIPTGGNIEHWLKTVSLKLAEPGDILVVYMAGHGMDTPDGTQFFLPGDLPLDPEAKPEERLRTLRRRAIAIQDVMQWLQESKATEKVLILDTCRTVADRSEVLVSNVATHRQRIMEAEANFVRVLASTGKSYPDDGHQHGAFTYRFAQALCQGDADKDGKVTLAEAFAAARRDLKRWVLEPGGKVQIPELRSPTGGAGPDRIVLSLRTGPAPSAVRSTPMAPSPPTPIASSESNGEAKKRLEREAVREAERLLEELEHAAGM